MTRHRTKAKDDLETFLDYAGLGTWAREYRFHPTRRWLMDYANVALKVGVEYDGVTGATAFNRRGDETSVGHVSVSGQMRDAEKTNEAQVLGWIVVRVNAKTIKSGDAFRWIEQTCHLRMEEAA